MLRGGRVLPAECRLSASGTSSQLYKALMFSQGYTTQHENGDFTKVTGPRADRLRLMQTVIIRYMYTGHTRPRP